MEVNSEFSEVDTQDLCLVNIICTYIVLFILYFIRWQEVYSVKN